MKLRMMLVAVAVCLGCAIVVPAQRAKGQGGKGALAHNRHLGTWKLNETKSKFAEGAAKNHTVVYEMSGDMIKVTVDGTDGEGNALHNEWTGQFDGKYYAETGSATADKRAYRTINSRKLSFTEKMGKKIVTTGTITFSLDGKTRTVITTTTDAKGRRLHNVAVYDKQ